MIRKRGDENNHPDDANQTSDNVNYRPDDVISYPDNVNHLPDHVNYLPDDVNVSPDDANYLPDFPHSDNFPPLLKSPFTNQPYWFIERTLLLRKTRIRGRDTVREFF